MTPPHRASAPRRRPATDQEALRRETGGCACKYSSCGNSWGTTRQRGARNRRSREATRRFRTAAVAETAVTHGCRKLTIEKTIDRLQKAKRSDFDEAVFELARNQIASHHAKFARKENRQPNWPDGQITAQFLAVAEWPKLEAMLMDLTSEGVRRAIRMVGMSRWRCNAFMASRPSNSGSTE
jgi:hypothetical protein